MFNKREIITMIEKENRANSLIDRLSSNGQLDKKQGLLRDLKNMLNTRASAHLLEAYPEISKSITSYGLIDFSQLEASSKKTMISIQKHLTNLLQEHEPRLCDIKITPLKSQKNSLSFNISATLLNEPDSIEIEFDSMYQPNLQEFDVRENIE